jgi:hypothetical protein
MIMDGPRYVPNTVIGRDLQIPTDKEEIHRLSTNTNDLAVNLMELPDNRPARFLV